MGRYRPDMAESRCAVQLHDATALHFDLRIQAGDVLRSWAVALRNRAPVMPGRGAS